MKLTLILAAILTSSLSHAGLRNEVGVIDCEVKAIEDSSSTSGIVTVGSEVSVKMIYEGNEFFGYKAQVGELSFPILAGAAGRSSFTQNTISRENLGDGEAIKIIEADVSRKIVILNRTEQLGANIDSELYIGSTGNEATPLAATLKCK